MEKFKALGINNQGALIAGALTIILSFFPSYVTVSAFGFSNGINAWHSFATLGILLVIAGTVVIAVKAFAADSLPAEVPWNVVATACAGVGAVLLLLRGLTAGSHTGLGWSGWALIITAIIMTVFAALSLKESGEDLSQFKKKQS